MKNFDLGLVFDNWRWILFGLMISVIFPTFIYQMTTLDPELKTSESRKRVKEVFETEIKELYIPKTAINKFEGNEKPHSVLVKSRYRTDMYQQEFVAYIKMELEKKGWVFYKKESEDIYEFCRGKYDATLYTEQKNVFEKGNYFSLYLSFGNRPLIDFGNLRPKSCQ